MSVRKKVLWLIKGLGAGGAERLLAMAIPYLNREAFDYEVAYCLAHKNDLTAEFEKADIPVFCLDLKTAHDPRAAYRLLRLLKERQPSVLHLHLPYTGILGRITGILAGTDSIVYTEHSVLEMYHPVTRLLNLLTYPLNGTTIAVSEEVQRSLMRHRIASRTKPVVIRNGIYLNHNGADRRTPDELRQVMGIPASHRVVGNVSHIRPEKGHEYLLRAARLVLDRCPEVTFVIVGREKINGEIHRLEEIADGLGIGNRIIFTGFRQDVYDLMEIFDLFVLPSLYEGLPVALLEAMSLGKPAVTTSVGGVPEVIEHGTNGLLVPSRNPEALAENITRLLQDRGLHDKISQRAAQTVRERFSMQEMVRSVEQLYSAGTSR